MATFSPQEACERILTALRRGEPLRLLGADRSLRGLVLARAAMGAGADSGGPIVHVAGGEQAARQVAADTAFFMGAEAPTGTSDDDGPILLLPELDVSPYADVSPDPRAVATRLAALTRLVHPSADAPRVVVTSLRALMRKVIARPAFERLCATWTVEQEVEREEAIARLVRGGYQRVDVVEDPGTFAVRGGVMDAFVPAMRFPVRIEWFGDEIERMRLFDAESQRSLRTIQHCLVHPVRETVATTDEPLRPRVLELADAANAPSSLSRQVAQNLEQGLDFFGIDAIAPILHDEMASVQAYLGDDARWFVEEPDALRALADRLYTELSSEHAKAVAEHRVVAPPPGFSLEPEALARTLGKASIVSQRLDTYEPERTDERTVVRIDVDASARLHAELETARKRKGAEILRPVVDHVRALTADDGPPWSVILAAPNLTHAERLTSLLRGYGLSLAPPRMATEQPLPLRAPDEGPTRVQVVAGDLSTGFSSEVDRVLLLSEADIFGRITRRVRRRRRAVGVGSLTQLSVGDYVVHVLHGVGRYAGLVKLTLEGIPGDFVQLEYAGTDRLYLPVYRLGEIERYVSADAKPPKLDKMGGATFETKTRKVKAEVAQIADELLQIYAQREAMEGHAYPSGGDVLAQFESTFPFEETPDQQEAIDKVMADLDRPQPMDRLICGDVGFGKTEVALRAAFRVALSGKQVAVLAPTTVLVQQHAHTFRERMEPFGVRVGRLNRLVDAKTRKETIAGLRGGNVDVVIGTHRLLGRDVRFADLGLVIIDEEQRFGVAQKERFKRLKTQVDVLTLSATPIPRTLHMSLLGVREISLVMTPPVDRLAIRTFLTRPSDTVIEEAIRKELVRGGQIFYVVPKIQGIEEHARRVRELVPEARVLVAHGKMPAELLEQTMVDFVEHQADVLVSTTIIESGLDIPRANTMFIARADMFGLSQLYQLRGRIGRSRHRAYCYLMVPSLERLAPDARRRLEAVQRYAELGSGFHVASQDLEIRGAGELLGARQSGQIQSIGFEAYSRILAEAVAELRGEPILRETDPEIAFDVAAYLPDDYVEDTGQRLDLYRRLSSAHTVEDVDGVMEEIRDRFGEPPDEAVHLGRIMACKTYGRRLRALAIELRGDTLALRFGPDTPLPPKVAANLHRETEGRLRLAPGDRIVATVPRGSGPRQTQLLACQRVLAELATHATAP
jgi:transcription-repair coupling factor (superfamily II helicase)